MYRPLIVLALALSGVAADAAAQSLTFIRDDYSSYAGARAIATADFNRDGWPDVAQANTGRNSVTILLAHPGAALTRAFDIAVGVGPFALTTADFNRDAVPDLAVANADSHTISILLGKGDGSFTRLADIPAPSQNPRGITAADINNDGIADLIYTGFAGPIVQVLIGSGSGGFTKGAAYTGSALQPQGLAAADFNHDGALDIAVAYASGLRILYGNGGTAFTARAVAGAANLNVLSAGDFNTDGWADVAAASTASSTVTIYLGGPTGLAAAQTYATGASPRGITVADLNDDGSLDVITANRRSSTVSILRGDRAHPGAFLAPIQVGAGTGSRDVVSGDFDGDGRIDLATGNEYAASATVLSNSTAFIRAAYVFKRLTLGTPSGVVGGSDAVWTADFNRDGRLDVLTLARNDPPTLAVLLTGGPTVTLPPVAGFDVGFATADFNLDGNPDVVSRTCCPDAATVSALLGDGRGAFSAPRERTSDIWGTALTIADMNRDARPDLLTIGWHRTTGEPLMQELIGNGDGTFRDGVQIPLAAWGRDVRAVDFNRDGNLDIAVLLGNRTLQIWLGTGLGGVSEPPVEMLFSGLSEDPVDVKFGDINRDGYPDAAVADGHQAAVALGTGTGFGEPTYMPIASWGWGSHVIFLADLDVNGSLDLITAGGDFFAGNGDGTFQPNQRFDFLGVGLQVVDFNRDGLPDIVFGTSQGEVGVLVNQRNGVNRPPAVTAGPDITVAYEQQIYGDSAPYPLVQAVGADPDLHALTFEWRDQAGTVVSTERGLNVWGKLPGTYRYTLKVEDGRGGVVTDAVAVTVAPTTEIVLHMCDDTVTLGGTWSFVSDPAAGGGCRAYDANFGAPKVTTPLTAPAGSVRLAFIADPTRTYKLWLRLKADNNSWANDSVWVQFTGSTDVSGTPKYRAGTTSGLAVSLEECSGCGVAGWGWEDDGWGAVNRNGVLLRFPEGGAQSIVIQTREDGVSVDHVVLSSQKYLTTRPGTAKNDTTILTQTWTPF